MDYEGLGLDGRLQSLTGPVSTATKNFMTGFDVESLIEAVGAGQISAGAFKSQILIGDSNIKIDGKNKRIIINDGTNDRILIGYQSGGF